MGARAAGAAAGPGTRGPLVLGAVTAAVLVAVSARYGYHRDELYFVAAGRHPAWGYDDQPPLTPLLAAGIDHLRPGSLVALRLPSALLTGVTVWLTGLVAREMGGSQRGQLLAALLAAMMPFLLVSGHLLTTSVPDVLAAVALSWIAVRVVRTGDDRLLLLAGPVLGVALLNKDLVGVIAAALVAALALVGPRWVLGSWRLWASVAVAAVLWLPYLVWQARHGWPQVDMSRQIRADADQGGPVGYLPFQVLLVGPPVCALLVAGLWRLLRVPAARRFRFVAVAYLLASLAFLVTGGKAYYSGGLLPPLMAAGAIAADGWLERGRQGLRRAALGTALVLSGVTTAFLALPLVPVQALRSTPIVAINYDAGETVGWPRLVAQVANAWDSLPPADRETGTILGSNYGNTSAINHYGPDHGLPTAYSGADALWRYGPPPESARPVLVVGYDDPRGLGVLGDCRLVRTLDNRLGVDNDEQHDKVWVCTGPAGSWAAAWPSLRHLG